MAARVSGTVGSRARGGVLPVSSRSRPAGTPVSPSPAYTSSVPASAMPRSGPGVVSAHQCVVASLGAGATARAIISPETRSRSAQSGPSGFFS